MASSIPLLVAAFLRSNICIHGVRAQCSPSGYLNGKPGHCNQENGAECCQAGKMYKQYRCSPPVTGATRAHMTINSFEEGGDGGGPSECDGRYHSNNARVVALSTGWYNGGNRCHKHIQINANGRSVLAKVVDECDSVNGCDKEHDYQPPCANNIVDASRVTGHSPTLVQTLSRRCIHGSCPCLSYISM